MLALKQVQLVGDEALQVDLFGARAFQALGLAHLFELQLEAVAQALQLGLDARQRRLGDARQEVFERLFRHREQAEDRVEVDTQPLVAHQPVDQLGLVLLEVAAGRLVVSLTKRDAGVGAGGELRQRRAGDGGLVPINRQVGFRQPGAVGALFGVVQPGAQAAEIDGALDQHGRAVGEPAPVLAVARVVPEFLNPFDD